MANSVECSAPPPDDVNGDEEEEDPQEDREDQEEDRVYDERVGQKIKALYESGWEVGEITYFNSVLDEYHVSFTDGSEDYINISDVDGVELQFI